MVILGIDPGTTRLGYGVIKSEKNKISLINYGCLPEAKCASKPDRLVVIFRELTHLIKKHRPDLFSIEELFFFKNAKTVMSVSEARGVAILAAASLNVPIVEFTPLQIKQAITGYGKAEKQQVQKMIKALLDLKETPQPDDAADALAIAICASHSHKFVSRK